MPAFSSRQFLSEATLARVTEARVADPDFSFRAAQMRQRRDRVAPDGRLNILAADHPGRRITRVGDRPLAMADRHDYLARIVRALSSDRVDGVMATMDILEDLLAIDAFRREDGAPPLLDSKLLLASLNRGGLAGAGWELDDPISGATPAACKHWRLDGAKILLRFSDGEPGVLKTLLATAQAITELNALGLPMFLEPLPVVRGEKGWTVVKERDALTHIVGVASALGDSSRYLWLKLPYCQGFEQVARATTLPILILGGESIGAPAGFMKEIAAALGAGANVRGALVGRNVLYPGDHDPLAVMDAAGGIIHEKWTYEQAVESLRLAAPAPV